MKCKLSVSLQNLQISPVCVAWLGWAGLGWAGLGGGGHAAPSHTAAVWAGPGVDILTIIIITMLQAAIISTILDYRFGAFDCNGIRLRMIT